MVLNPLWLYLVKGAVKHWLHKNITRPGLKQKVCHKAKQLLSSLQYTPRLNHQLIRDIYLNILGYRK